MIVISTSIIKTLNIGILQQSGNDYEKFTNMADLYESVCEENTCEEGRHWA